MDRSRFSSAAVTERFPTVCRSCPAGTTPCGSIVHAPKFSMEAGRFHRRSLVAQSQQQLRKPNVTVAIRRFHQLLSMTGGLKEKDDGSLALYLQKDKPAQDRISTGCPLRRVRSTSRCVSMTPRRLCATVRINCRQSSGSGDTYSVCKGEPIWQPSRRHSPNLVLPA